MWRKSPRGQWSLRQFVWVLVVDRSYRQRRAERRVNEACRLGRSKPNERSQRLNPKETVNADSSDVGDVPHASNFTLALRIAYRSTKLLSVKPSATVPSLGAAHYHSYPEWPHLSSPARSGVSFPCKSPDCDTGMCDSPSSAKRAERPIVSNASCEMILAANEKRSKGTSRFTNPLAYFQAR